MKKDENQSAPFAVSGFMSDMNRTQSNILELKYLMNNQRHLKRSQKHKINAMKGSHH